MFRVLILTLWVSSVAAASAEDCSDINLISHVTRVSDQGNNGSCYAFAAEELLHRYYRGSYPDGFSANSIAQTYGEYLWRRQGDLVFKDVYSADLGFDGGYVIEAIRASYGSNRYTENWRGLCLHHKFPDTIQGRPVDTYVVMSFFPFVLKLAIQDAGALVRANRNVYQEQSFAELLLRIERELEKPDRVKDYENECIRQMSQLGLDPSECSYLARTFDRLVEAALPNLTKTDLTQFVYTIATNRHVLSHTSSLKIVDQLTNPYQNFNKELTELDKFQFAKLILDRACAPYVKPPRYGDLPLYSSSADPSWFDGKKWEVFSKDFIDYFLEHGKPVSIGYLTDGLIVPSRTPTKHGKHVSVIVGRRQIQGECHYLVKNSWGKEWSPPRRLKGIPVYDKKTRKLVRGYFFLPASYLRETYPVEVKWKVNGRYQNETRMFNGVYEIDAISSQRWNY